MAVLKWDQPNERLYETGVKKGVLYVKKDKVGEDGNQYDAGVAWNGLISVTQSPSGAEASPLYANDIKYLELMSNEEFGGTIEAYTYPDEFAKCNGEIEFAPGVKVSQQTRKAFGFCYRTTVGNDGAGDDYGYKLHIVYSAKAAPSEKAYSTVNDSPEAITFSWEFTTTPEEIGKIEGLTATFKPTSHIEIDSTTANPDNLQTLEDLLYGTESAEASLPTPSKIYEIMSAGA